MSCAVNGPPGGAGRLAQRIAIRRRWSNRSPPASTRAEWLHARSAHSRGQDFSRRVRARRTTPQARAVVPSARRCHAPERSSPEDRGPGDGAARSLLEGIPRTSGRIPAACPSVEQLLRHRPDSVLGGSEDSVGALISSPWRIRPGSSPGHGLARHLNGQRLESSAVERLTVERLTTTRPAVLRAWDIYEFRRERYRVM